MALLLGLELSPGGLLTLFLEPELVLSVFKLFFPALLLRLSLLVFLPLPLRSTMELLLLELNIGNPGCQLLFKDVVRLRSCRSSTETDTQILKGGCKLSKSRPRLRVGGPAREYELPYIIGAAFLWPWQPVTSKHTLRDLLVGDAQGPRHASPS